MRGACVRARASTVCLSAVFVRRACPCVGRACARVRRVFVRRVCPPCVPVRRACVRASPPCAHAPCARYVCASCARVRAWHMAHRASRIPHRAFRIAPHRTVIRCLHLFECDRRVCVHGARRIAQWHRAPRIAHRASPHIARRSASRVSCRRSSEPADQASQLIGQKVTRWP